MAFENTILVIGKTRLEQLIERFNTKAQAKFYIEHAGGNFSEYELEHETFQRSLNKVVEMISHFSKHKVIDRKFLPNFIFSNRDLIVALGQDGLVANTAKYVNGQPILGVNPDPLRNDGILLPYTSDTLMKGLTEVFEERFKCRHVTMAQAKTSDGQSLLAFNDLFIGPASHTSARYKITYGVKSEIQSSSGLIVSTGAGSTGWLSSVVNMSNGVHSAFQKNPNDIKLKMKWDEDRLVFVVREPFLSKHSNVSISAGFVTTDKRLVLESNMPFNGVIFSDGIEADFLKFNSGCSVEIGIAKQKANIVESV